MTEKEAMSRIKDHMEIHRLKEPRAIYITIALSMAITALKEIQQYREIGTVKECKEMASIVKKSERSELATIIDEWLKYRKIGTVEECREAVEKQKPKRPIKDKWKHDCCPSCGWFVSEETGWGDRYNPNCENCGQAIQWNENLEEMEDERD